MPVRGHINFTTLRQWNRPAPWNRRSCHQSSRCLHQEEFCSAYLRLKAGVWQNECQQQRRLSSKIGFPTSITIALFGKYGTQPELCSMDKVCFPNFPEAIAPRKGVRWPHASLLLAGWSVDILRNEQPWAHCTRHSAGWHRHLRGWPQFRWFWFTSKSIDRVVTWAERSSKVHLCENLGKNSVKATRTFTTTKASEWTQHSEIKVLGITRTTKRRQSSKTEVQRLNRATSRINLITVTLFATHRRPTKQSSNLSHNALTRAPKTNRMANSFIRQFMQLPHISLKCHFAESEAC